MNLIVAWLYKCLVPSQCKPSIEEKRKADKAWRIGKHSVNPDYDPEIHIHPKPPGGSGLKSMAGGDKCPHCGRPY